MRPALGGLVLVAAAAVPAAALAQAPPPGIAPDRETVELRVLEGESCEDIARRLYGDPRYYFVVAEHLPGLSSVLRTECDRALRPGATVRLPRRAVADGSQPDARLTAVRRQVRSRPPRAEAWAAAAVGQELWRGWRVSTLEGSTAELTFEDSSRVHLRERTLVVIYGGAVGTDRAAASKATLERGTLRSRLGELEGRLTVETPSARAELEAGEALVSVDREETSRVANHRGAPATVTAPDGRGRVRLHPGMGTTVRRGRTPSRPRPLPSSPVLEGGPGLLAVGLAGLGATARVGFRPVDGAVSYVVEVLAGGGAGGPAEVVRAPASVRAVELRGLPPGSHAVRVAAVDAEGLESRPSAPLALAVAELAVWPRWSGGRDEPPRLLEGTRLVAPVGLGCTFGPAPPSRELVLAEPGPRTIRCSGDDERAAAELAVVVVEVSARVSGLAPGEPLTLRRGGSRRVEVELSAAADLPPGLELVAGPGLEAEPARGGAAGRLSAEVRADLEAPATSSLEVVARGEPGSEATLARLAVETRRAPAEPERPEAEPEPAPTAAELWLGGPSSPLEGSALLLQGGSFGVRDEVRPGAGAHLAAGWVGELRGEGRRRHRAVVAGGLRASFLDERLRLAVAVHVPEDRGPGGGLLAVSSRLLAGRRFGLAVELAAFVPFGGDEQRGGARLLPSVDGSLRLGDRVTLRTRQGGLVDLEGDGPRLWSSAYGLDLHAIGPLGLGLEAILLAGVEEGRAVVAPAASLGLSLSFHLVTASVLARYAFTDAAADLLGQVAVLGAVAVTAPAAPQGADGRSRGDREAAAR